MHAVGWFHAALEVAGSSGNMELFYCCWTGENVYRKIKKGWWRHDLSALTGATELTAESGRVCSRPQSPEKGLISQMIRSTCVWVYQGYAAPLLFGHFLKCRPFVCKTNMVKVYILHCKHTKNINFF